MMIYINKLIFDFIKHYNGILDSSLCSRVCQLRYFGYTIGGAVVVPNIPSCCPLDSFNFITKCLLPGMPNWGAVLTLRTNICVISCFF